jgi:hypothetical protein
MNAYPHGSALISGRKSSVVTNTTPRGAAKANAVLAIRAKAVVFMGKCELRFINHPFFS